MNTGTMLSPSQRRDRIAQLEADIQHGEKEQAKTEYTVSRLQEALDVLASMRELRISHDKEDHGSQRDLPPIEETPYVPYRANLDYRTRTHVFYSQETAIRTLDEKLYCFDQKPREQFYTQLYKLVQQVHSCLLRYDSAGLRHTTAAISRLVLEFKDERQKLLLSMTTLMQCTSGDFDVACDTAMGYQEAEETES
ncbi:hypothetical protein Tdes44962_MAKER08450 [Teratosphaeria destructans]|uniref:Uncharacterized protein n=1 Tax=Teratosphaeria destructans TaxID=418781 RepID=A0A9W7SX10_9PEZI|nr:hypothetical protein Tdes44962_MAKER08450 [Teratosphaeria destructans]